jgi:hypothetical protein
MTERLKPGIFRIPSGVIRTDTRAGFNCDNMNFAGSANKKGVEVQVLDRTTYPVISISTEIRLLTAAPKGRCTQFRSGKRTVLRSRTHRTSFFAHWIKFLLALPLSLFAQTSTDPGGVLSALTVTRFAAGNIYVAGTTGSPNFPVKNAAQPTRENPFLMRSLDRGATWQKLADPPAAPLTFTPHPTDPKTMFAASAVAIYKSTDFTSSGAPAVVG